MYLYMLELQMIFFVLCVCFSQIKSSEGITISKEGTFHKLKIHKVTEEFAGKYKFEADGRKTEAVIAVEGKKMFLTEITYLHREVVSFIRVPASHDWDENGFLSTAI